MALATTEFEVEEQYDLPEGCVADGVTAGGIVVALYQARDGRLGLIWGDGAVEPIDAIVRTRDDQVEFWSADGQHLAFIAMRGEEAFVVRDGVLEGPYDDVSASVRPVFSEDGRHLAYGATIGGTTRLVVDGAVQGGEALAPIQAVFSPDGTRLAYAEMRSVGKEHEARVVLDAEPGPWLAAMRNARGALRFSPDSRRFAYYRLDGRGHGQWVVDGVEQQLVNDVRPIGLAQMRGIAVLDPPLPAAFSPNGTRFAYEADVLEKGVAVVEDDRPGPLLRAAGVPVFSADSRHLAYAGEAFDKRTGLVLDGVLGPTLAMAGSGLPTFSPDSRRVAMAVETQEGGLLRKKRQQAMLVDGALIGRRDGTDVSLRPTWSPDGRELAWWVQVRENEVGLLRNGEELGPFTGLYGDPVFAPSGRLIYVARTHAGTSVFVDGRPGPMTEGVTYAEPPAIPRGDGVAVPMFRLSPDGEHIAWAGVVEGRQHPVLDDRVGPAFDMVLGSRFDADGVARWWAQRGRKVVRVSAVA